MLPDSSILEFKRTETNKWGEEKEKMNKKIENKERMNERNVV
jgi:hypothetical protein